MHGLVAKDVLILLGSTRHFVLATKSQNLDKADVEEEAFHNAAKDNQRTQEFLIVLKRSRFELWIGQNVDEGDEELIFVTNGCDLVIGIEDLRLVKTERLDNVLIGMGVNGLFERLSKQVLPALGRGNVPIGAKHNVIGSKAIGRYKEPKIALNNPALVFGKTIGVLPKSDVSGHIDFLRHPVIRTARQVLLPSPLVFKGDELVNVGTRVNDALIFNTNSTRSGISWRSRRQLSLGFNRSEETSSRLRSS